MTRRKESSSEKFILNWRRDEGQRTDDACKEQILSSFLNVPEERDEFEQIQKKMLYFLFFFIK